MTEYPAGPIGAAQRQQDERDQRTADTYRAALTAVRTQLGHAGYRADDAACAAITASVLAALRPDRREQPGRHTVDTITSDALDQLYADADRSEEVIGELNEQVVRAIKQAEAAIARAAEERATLHQLFEGFARLLATSSRDWSAYRVDAWLYAIVCGWDCEEAVHGDTCVHGAMDEMAHAFGWDADTVAKARRYRNAVRALAPPEPGPPPVHIGGRVNAEDCPACSGTNPDWPFICPGEPGQEDTAP